MQVAVIDLPGFTPQYDERLCEALVAQGCEVTLVSAVPPGAERGRKYRQEYPVMYRWTRKMRMKTMRRLLRGLGHLYDISAVGRYLAKEKPDVIHVQWLALPLLDKLFVKRMERVAPVIYTVHDSTPYLGAPSSKVQLLGIWSAYRAFSCLITHTECTRNRLLEQRVVTDADKVVVVPHGVFDHYPKLLGDFEGRTGPDSNQMPDRKVQFLFFGVIKFYKGLDVLLKAVGSLAKEDQEKLQVNIVGLPHKSIRSELKLANELRINHLLRWELRYVSEKAVASYFANAEVILMPYRKIDQSGVLMTAAAFRKPVIASRVGGIPETLREHIDGLMVEPANVHELAAAIRRIIRDKAYLEKLRMNAWRDNPAIADWQYVAARTIGVYEAARNRWENR